MDYYYHQINELHEDFEEALSKYPLFKEMIDNIFDRDIKEINELLEKNDEYYLKKAIDKLKDLIKYIKDTSEEIDKEYAKFDTLAKEWEQKEIINIEEKELNEINSLVKKANILIKSHDLKDIEEANKIMAYLIKKVK